MLVFLIWARKIFTLSFILATERGIWEEGEICLFSSLFVPFVPSISMVYPFQYLNPFAMLRKIAAIFNTGFNRGGGGDDDDDVGGVQKSFSYFLVCLRATPVVNTKLHCCSYYSENWWCKQTKHFAHLQLVIKSETEFYRHFFASPLAMLLESFWKCYCCCRCLF